jgi:hypothetical protein
MKYDNIISISPSRSGHFFIMSNIFSWLGYEKEWGDINFYNLENIPPHRFSKVKRLNVKPPEYILDDKDKLRDYVKSKRKVDFSKNTLYIITTRDYLNWGASVIKNYTDIENNDDDASHYMMFYLNKSTTDNWLHITKEVMGYTKYTKSTKILYDKFKNNKDYREGICRSIGGIYNENKLFEMSKYGSSFGNLNTDERYKDIINEPFFDEYIDMMKGNVDALKFYMSNFDLDDNKKDFINQYLF